MVAAAMPAPESCSSLRRVMRAMSSASLQSLLMEGCLSPAAWRYKPDQASCGNLAGD